MILNGDVGCGLLAAYLRALAEAVWLGPKVCGCLSLFHIIM